MSTLGWRFSNSSGSAQGSGPTVGGLTAIVPPAGQFWITPPSLVKAGVVGDSGSVVTLRSQWTPSNGAPPPLTSLTYGVSDAKVIDIGLSKTTNGYAYGLPVDYNGPPPYGTGMAFGLLEIFATIDGVDAANSLTIAMSAGQPYADNAFGYGIVAPSEKWTNLRQVLEA